jgi:hypothetical protein
VNVYTKINSCTSITIFTKLIEAEPRRAAPEQECQLTATTFYLLVPCFLRDKNIFYAEGIP